MTVEETERLRRVQALAVEVFTDKDKADRWLRQPLAELGSETPLAIAQTKAGSLFIMNILAKIAWGAAA